MKIKINKLDKEIIERLQDQGMLLSKNAQQISRDKVFILIGEAMLDKIVNEINEFVSLWRELFPNCRLQDFEASGEKKILGGQDLAENGNSETTIQQEMPTGAGIEYWNIIMPRRKAEKAGHRFIYDLFRDRKIEYKDSKKKDANYKQQYLQQFLAGYTKNYQVYHVPKQLKSYSYGRIELPSLYKSFGEPAKNTRNLSPFTKMPQLYQRQIGSKSFELGTGSYKSLESYLNDYKEMI